jgi:hypothetical protein
VAAGQVCAAALAEVLLDRYVAQGEITADGNLVELERGSRRETCCL